MNKGFYHTNVGIMCPTKNAVKYVGISIFIHWTIMDTIHNFILIYILKVCQYPSCTQQYLHFFSTHIISSKFGHHRQSKSLMISFFFGVSDHADIFHFFSIIHVNCRPVISSFVWIKLEEIGQGNSSNQLNALITIIFCEKISMIIIFFQHFWHILKFLQLSSSLFQFFPDKLEDICQK